MAIEIGLQGHSETLVEQEDTAKSVGSGDLLVYATPCMAALMEGAACESIAPYLAEGAEPLRLDREEIMALGVAVREFPLCSSGRYIRHNPDELARAILSVWQEFRTYER